MKRKATWLVIALFILLCVLSWLVASGIVLLFNLSDKNVLIISTCIFPVILYSLYLLSQIYTLRSPLKKKDAPLLTKKRHQKYIHKDGYIHPAISQEWNRTDVFPYIVYIVDGKVQMLEKDDPRIKYWGTRVDTLSSDRTIQIFDPRKNERKELDPSDNIHGLLLLEDILFSGAPTDYKEGVRIIIIDFDGIEKKATIIGRMDYNSYEQTYEKSPYGSFIGYILDEGKEERHERKSVLDCRVIGFYST